MQLERSTTQASEAPSISRKKKYGLWALAWAGAGVVTTCPPSLVPFPFLLFFAWMFPLGLPGLFVAKGADVGPEWLFFGWVLYIGLTVFALRLKSRAGFYFFYAVLIVLLVLNATGCRVQVAHVHLGC
jgi:hypothetical protein